MPIARDVPAGQVRDAVVRPVPAEGLGDDQLIDHLRDVLIEWGVQCGHPRFLAYVTGSGTVPGAVADMLASAVNMNVGGWQLSPSASEIELAPGAVDPIADIARVCADEGVWLHVDAAYGGPAVLAPDLRPQLAGIERADSIAFDPHKWLYIAQSAGCVLIRDLQHLADAYQVHATYVWQDLERTGAGLSLAELGPQYSRGFQALKVWLSLLAHGSDAYARRISHDAQLAHYMAARIEERPDLELAVPVGLSICCFAYVPERPSPPEYVSRLNERIMTELQLDGRVYISNAVLGDRFVLRACFVNHRTEADDVDAVLDVVTELGARLDAEMRSPSTEP